jgi:hypothetical protein
MKIETVWRLIPSDLNLNQAAVDYAKEKIFTAVNLLDGAIHHVPKSDDQEEIEPWLKSAQRVSEILESQMSAAIITIYEAMEAKNGTRETREFRRDDLSRTKGVGFVQYEDGLSKPLGSTGVHDSSKLRSKDNKGAEFR